MTKTKICLIDSLMGLHNYQNERWTLTGTPIDPQKVSWEYLGGTQDCAATPLTAEKLHSTEDCEITLITEKEFFNLAFGEIRSKYKAVLINECEEIHPWAYKNLNQIENAVDFILTHNKQLLERSEKYVKVVGPGTTWVTDDNAQVHNKTKLLSHIASKLNWARGHKLRHLVTQCIEGRYEVDLWGSAHKGFEKKQKYLPLKDYCFSITVMNADYDNYFTETLVDTFRCGTVPIFWGCSNIDEFFNPKGILKFNNPIELKSILDNLSFEQYQEMLPYVKENFERAKDHIHFDDQVHDAIMTEIKRRENVQ